MIVWMMTDFDMTFTGDLFKIAWQNRVFFPSQFQYLKKTKIG